MAEGSVDVLEFRLTVRSFEVSRDPELVDRYVRDLRDRISLLYGLETTEFTFLLSPIVNSLEGAAAGGSAASGLYSGLQFKLPCDRFRVVLRSIGDWLERTALTNLFLLELPPTHAGLLKTSDPKSLAQLLPLGELLPPVQEIYVAKAKQYIDVFGEITPAARANLDILRHHFSLSVNEAAILDKQVLGTFRTLAEKYEHFRAALLTCKEESDLDGDFWAVMQDRTKVMGLPKADADFLKAERRHTLQSAAAEQRRNAEATREVERQRLQAKQQRDSDYRQVFETLVREAEAFDLSQQPKDHRHRALVTILCASDWVRGRLYEAREFYELETAQAETLEKTVVDRLFP